MNWDKIVMKKFETLLWVSFNYFSMVSLIGDWTEKKICDNNDKVQIKRYL